MTESGQGYIRAGLSRTCMAPKLLPLCRRPDHSGGQTVAVPGNQILAVVGLYHVGRGAGNDPAILRSTGWLCRHHHRLPPEFHLIIPAGPFAYQTPACGVTHDLTVMDGQSSPGAVAYHGSCTAGTTPLPCVWPSRLILRHGPWSGSSIP